MRKLWDLLRNKIGTKNLICGILGICIAVGWMWSFTAWRVALVDKKICETQRGIADEVFRFHVLANSDSEKDQRVKLKVRDAVIAYMTSEMPGTTNQMDHAVTMDQAEQMNPGIHKNSAQATKKWAESHLNDLILVADEVLEREGMDYQADAHVTKCCFPEKKYGDMTFPQGEYEALRITLGEAAGHNWWCVLYPTSITRKATISAAIYSILPCPNGCSLSAGFPAIFTPIRLMIEEPASYRLLYASAITEIL